MTWEFSMNVHSINSVYTVRKEFSICLCSSLVRLSVSFLWCFYVKRAVFLYSKRMVYFNLLIYVQPPVYWKMWIITFVMIDSLWSVFYKLTSGSVLWYHHFEDNLFFSALFISTITNTSLSKNSHFENIFSLITEIPILDKID